MKIGLALSGGGAKGIVHAGVIKAILERDITISKISGTSAGALIGALFAAGIQVEEMLHFFQKSNLFHPRKYAFNQAGFIKSSLFATQISAIIPQDTFESLNIPLSITATDVLRVKSVVFDSGPLYEPLLASAAFPGIFTPVTIEGNTYIDGGVMNNFPADLLSDCDLIIGSYANKVGPLAVKKLKRSYDIASRAFSINQFSKDSPKFDLCDVLIMPSHLQDYGLFSFKGLEKIFQMGYDSATKKLDASPHFKI